jgi:hypothetical protein
MKADKPDPYQPCPCGSGKKYKFCCYAQGQLLSSEHPLALIKKASQFPVSQCAVNVGWQQQGMANVFVIRQLPNGKFMFGVYLVDLMLLGVKDTFFNANLGAESVQSMLKRTDMPVESIDYEDARSLIFGGIEFAQQNDFEPHPDWENSKHIIEPERPFQPKFSFGLDGKPVYYQGLDDDVDEILAKLPKP